ncbi:protein Wiz-like isoform X3 [Boleophthalmus pectinirostris]|uniref:protein Wiz-like isoform X3 n=1 Tax=Boleophthalmus pectinirostris TaxID=150288 RepID=UPI0024306D85|nr:protein Wiz-like isoform X3 [Boleophthalmus pectinirostris]
MDSQAPAQLIVCEVCGSFFDSRRGLANHARGHLRQLGVSEPDTTEELHVCHLCGCWCETRKGLSSHARSHLRQLGIPDGDGNPIETLYQLMEEEDLKPVNCETTPALQSSPLTKATKRPAEVSSPMMSTPNKQPKKGNFYCVLCGETFENHKGLAIHSRYHLRHFGVDDLLGKESSIEAIQELIESGVLKPLPKN